MTLFEKKLMICGVSGIEGYRARDITHIVSISNPGAKVYTLDWFAGQRLDLQFGDVVSEADALQWGTEAATKDDLRQAIHFITKAWSSGSARVLLHCDYGASRSPALAYVAVTHELGPGSEKEALETVLEICPVAVPNWLVVKLGDALLGREGQLFEPIRHLYQKIEREIQK